MKSFQEGVLNLGPCGITSSFMLKCSEFIIGASRRSPHVHGGADGDFVYMFMGVSLSEPHTSKLRCTVPLYKYIYIMVRPSSTFCRS